MPNRQYELVYILAPTATDAEVETLQGEFDGHIQTLGGAVESTDLWGRRKLAYAIGRFKEGIYVVQLIRGPGVMISELGRRLRVRDQVLRYLTVRVDEDLRKAQRAAEKRKATTERRRAVRVTPGTAPSASDAGPPAPAANVAPAADAISAAEAAPADDAAPADGETDDAASPTSEVQE